jgi:hypothetical protein
MHEGNTEEENDGYVVFNPRISWDIGRRYFASPHSFLQQGFGQIFQDDITDFSFSSERCKT